MITGSTALCSCSLLNLEEQLPHVTSSILEWGTTVHLWATTSRKKQTSTYQIVVHPVTQNQA